MELINVIYLSSINNVYLIFSFPHTMKTLKPRYAGRHNLHLSQTFDKHCLLLVNLVSFYMQNRILTLHSVSKAAKALARRAVKVLFPTPPFPDKTRILCLTEASRLWTSCTPTKTKVTLNFQCHSKQ